MAQDDRGAGRSRWRTEAEPAGLRRVLGNLDGAVLVLSEPDDVGLVRRWRGCSAPAVGRGADVSAASLATAGVPVLDEDGSAAVPAGDVGSGAGAPHHQAERRGDPQHCDERTATAAGRGPGPVLSVTFATRSRGVACSAPRRHPHRRHRGARRTARPGSRHRHPAACRSRGGRAGRRASRCRSPCQYRFQCRCRCRCRCHTVATAVTPARSGARAAASATRRAGGGRSAG